MVALPIGKGAYKRSDNPEIKLVNLHFETDPSNLEDQASLISRPGLAPYVETNGSETRAVHRQEGSLGGIVLTVVGTQLYKVDSVPNTTPLGTIAGTEPCTIAANATSAMIATGTTLYSTDGSTVSTASFPDGANVTSVDIIGGRYVFTRGGSQRFYWSDINSTTINALSYAAAENEPDELVCCKRIGDELWLFGRSSIEVWVPTGDADLPFIRVNGRLFGIGCASRATLQRIKSGAEEQIYWIGAVDRRAYRTAPNPQQISDPGIDEKLAAASVANMKALCAQADSHTYYSLSLGPVGSITFDTAGSWAEWQSQGRADFRGRYSTPLGDGRYVIGSTTGKLYVLDGNRHNDDGDQKIRYFTGLVPAVGRMRCNNVILDCDVGASTDPTANPKISMRYSDDRGRTWSEWDAISLGRQGEYGNRVVWNRLGLIERPGRLFEWRMSDDVQFTVRTAHMNERV